MRALVPALLFLACFAFGCGGADQLDRRQVSGTVELGHTVADVPVRGFQVQVQTVSRGLIEGELLAADAHGLWVLSASGPAAIPRGEIREVGVDLRDSRAGAYGAWMGLGTASTLSHGFFLIFSAPIWLATGIPTTATEVEDSEETADQGTYEALYQFARFPQGPTAALTRAVFGDLDGAPRQEPRVPPPADAATPPGTEVPPAPGGEVPPAPGGEVPPAPGGEVPPAPGGEVPPAPGGEVPPAPGGEVPPAPGGEVPPAPGGEVPPAPGGEVPPAPGGEVPPAPGGEAPPPGAEPTPPSVAPRPPAGDAEPPAGPPEDTPTPDAPPREGGAGLSPPPPRT